MSQTPTIITTASGIQTLIPEEKLKESLLRSGAINEQIDSIELLVTQLFCNEP